MIKVPVLVHEHYIMYIEEFNDLYWFHTDVFKWSSSVKKTYVRDLDRLQQVANKPLYALIEQENTKLNKFAKSIGFKEKETTVLNNNKQAYIFSRSI